MAVYEVLSELVPPAHVLELGAGTGQATIELARRGYRVSAIEPGAQMAAALQAKLRGGNVEGVVARLLLMAQLKPSAALAPDFFSKGHERGCGGVP